jgi:murein DD-endopeptidase MepM/ murein hydrolase activator NlpD
MGELDEPVVVAFPLRGEWSVERTPAYRIPSHGTDLLGQRYAYDLVRTDHRPGFHLHPAGTLRFLLIGGRTRDCYGWGQPVHAAFDGVIVQVVDGVAERQWLHVVRESWLAVKNTLAFARRGLDPARLAGNHVIVGTGGTYALYAHLAPGSVVVTKGQRVRVGEVLGRVGHTGNSTAPHLHFQLMDSADPLQARGIPCAFAAYLVERDGQWQRVERGIPTGASVSARSHRSHRPWLAGACRSQSATKSSATSSPGPGGGVRRPADPTQPVAAHHSDRPQ